MKYILSFLSIVIFSMGAYSQKSCCSSTQKFASLNNEEGFATKHELKEYSMMELQGEMISFSVDGGEDGQAYFVKSEVNSNKYLLVFHEWWGLNDHIKAEADVWFNTFDDVNVIALDLYDGKVAEDRETAGKLMQSADEERIHKLINGAVEYFGEDAKFATIGWCFGGGWSMQAALILEERAVASVVYYGMPENEEEKLAKLKCEVMGHFAEQDQWINHKAVGEYQTAMDEAGKNYKTFWYDAAHAFANPSNAKYDEKNATIAFKRSEEFLRSKFSEE